MKLVSYCKDNVLCKICMGESERGEGARQAFPARVRIPVTACMSPSEAHSWQCVLGCVSGIIILTLIEFIS